MNSTNEFLLNGIKLLIKSELYTSIYNLFNSFNHTLVPIILDDSHPSRFIWLAKDQEELDKFEFMMYIVSDKIKGKFSIIDREKNQRSTTLIIYNDKINLVLTLSFIIILQDQEYIDKIKDQINYYTGFN